MLVKYSCGCIGFLPSTSDGKSLLVTVCDRNQDDFDDYSLGYRFMPEVKQGKEPTPLTEVEEKKIFQEMSELLHLGYQMRSLAHTFSTITGKQLA
jgi:hypothetical protein